MGGDRGPGAILEGAMEALPALEGELTIVGDEPVLTALLQSTRKLAPLAKAIAQGANRARCQVRIEHAPEVIEMGDTIRSLRSKPNASINVGCRMAAQSWKDRKSGECSAFISTGHSGAMMASALMHMGRLGKVERPAIAITLPTLSVDGCTILDVGANVDCKPEHLRDFAVMGALFAQVDRKSSSLPRVGVLSNGEERSKGNELTRQSVALIEKLPCFSEGLEIAKFIGYVESKEIFKGQVDVVVTDGFVGNIVLKSLEGLGFAVVQTLKDEAKRNPFSSIGLLLSAGVLRRLKRKLDYAEYGAAPLLGVAGYAFICHGRSNPKAIHNALLRAQSALRKRIVERLEEALEKGF